MASTPPLSQPSLLKRARPTVSYQELDEEDIEDDEPAPAAKKQKPVATGRGPSYPGMAFAPTSKSTKLVKNHKTHKKWNDPTQKGIRLVYPNLQANGAHEGVFIQDPAITSSTDVELHKHLNKIAESMETKQSSHQLTEATGEAATALAMLRLHPAARMVWGMHVHSGAGIDQIWKTDAQGTTPATYYIVEAKGPGAGLTNKTFGPPPEVQEQMSLGWILDNLVRMQKNHPEYADDLLKECGLAEKTVQGKPYYANYGGVAKSYYACSYNASAHKAGLWAVVIEAQWLNDQLGYHVLYNGDIGSQLAKSSALK